MAVIFYWSNRGSPAKRPVHGVHSDVDISVPAGVVSMTVSGKPDKIAWPVPLGRSKGSEHWSVVDTTGAQPVLVVDSALVPLPDPDAKMKTDLQNLPPTPLRDILVAWLTDRGVS